MSEQETPITDGCQHIKFEGGDVLVIAEEDLANLERSLASSQAREAALLRALIDVQSYIADGMTLCDFIGSRLTPRDGAAPMVALLNLRGLVSHALAAAQPVHDSDCAVAVNGRHDCSCGAMPAQPAKRTMVCPNKECAYKAVCRFLEPHHESFPKNYCKTGHWTCCPACVPVEGSAKP